MMPTLPGVQAGKTISLADAQAMVQPPTFKKLDAPKAANGERQMNYEPFSYSATHRAPPPESNDPTKVWEPPVRESLIDRLPRHPNASWDSSRGSIG
jgi:hypothetical protein